MNAKPTPAKWKIAAGVQFYHRHPNQIIVAGGDMPYLVADLREATMPREEAEANAALIVAAVNVCFAINPDNPLAVAEALPGLVEVAHKIEAYLQGIRLRSDEFEEADLVALLQKTLAKLGAKP